MATPTDLHDTQWARIHLLLPPPRDTGRPRNNDRRTLNEILFVLRNGLRWQDRPAQYGHYSTGWKRLAAELPAAGGVVEAGSEAGLRRS